MKNMRHSKFLYLFLILTVLVSATSSVNGVIKSKYKFLIGEYELISVQDEGKILTPNSTGKVTLTITKKDKMLIYDDGKLVSQYDFMSGRSPIPTETENYVLFNKENDIYAFIVGSGNEP